MKEDKAAVKSSAGKENEPVTENATKKKSKEDKPATKVVVRRLPPSMTEEQFKMQVSPIPDYDYFYFVPADKSLMPNAFSRAYINFTDQNDLFIFTQKFDGYVFVDSKGGEFPAVVEFAPFQRIPKNRPNRKKDSKVGTIESDPIYIAFKERMEAENLENKTTVNASKQHFFETSLAPEKKEELSNTPLLDFIRNKRAERQKIREEKREEKRKKDLERRRAKEEQRRGKKEDETSVVKVLSSQNVNKERPKEKDAKQSFIKKKSDEVKTTIKDKVIVEIRTKDSKPRTGKSYLEERQRQAERREEQRKKLSQSQSKSSVTDVKTPLNPDESGDTPASESKPHEDITTSVSENKGKETEYKKPERTLKREERRSSYKYEKYDSKRERDNEDSRRSRRANERSYQNNRRDDEKTDDGGRKRYSESRRSHDNSQRDRYKDKEKNKGYGQKKTVSVTELDKNKSAPESSEKKPDISENSENNHSEIKEENKSENDQMPKLDPDNSQKVNTGQEELNKIDLEAKPKTLESTKPTRRKSLDYDKSRSSPSYNKLYIREKYSEKKRRNSMGSSKHTNESTGFKSHQNEKEETISKTKDFSLEKLPDDKQPSNESQSKVSESEEKSAREREIRKEFEDNYREIPKRRNSTGERQVPEKMSPRRNSLGSEDKNQESTFKEQKIDGEAISEEEKTKDENKGQQNKRDPRTERRIRNKDRPSLEIYRPGMGRFSKQRMEREKEKGLGSSTEVDSPSPSPSPTPHKSSNLH